MSALPTIVDPLQVSIQAVWEALSEPYAGFNEGLASLQVQYGITSYAIEWGPLSDNFMFAQIDPEMVDVTQWIKRFPAVSIFASEAQQENSQKFATFSGPVAAAVDFWLEFRRKNVQGLGSEQDTQGDYEKIGNASLAVAASIIRHSDKLPAAGVNYIRHIAAKNIVDVEGDGWGQRCTLGLELRVSL